MDAGDGGGLGGMGLDVAPEDEVVGLGEEVGAGGAAEGIGAAPEGGVVEGAAGVRGRGADLALDRREGRREVREGEAIEEEAK